MTEAVAKQETVAVVEKIADYLEERRPKSDRRQAPHVQLPPSIERRSGDRRG